MSHVFNFLFVMIFLSLSHPLHPHSYSGVYRHLHSFPSYVSNALHRLHSRGGATVVTLNTGNKTFNLGLLPSFIHNWLFPFLPCHPLSPHISASLLHHPRHHFTLVIPSLLFVASLHFDYSAHQLLFIVM